MKTLRVFFVFCFFGSVALLRGDEASKYTPESRTTTETFVTKVLKVYAFQEGDAEYVAYVVDWKGHEVVVVPSGRREGDMAYKEGDSIRCGMMQSNQHVGDTMKVRTSFYVTGNSETPVMNAAQLEEVAAEVKSRREKREAVSARMPKLEAGKRGEAIFSIEIGANGEVVIGKEVVDFEALKEKLSAVAKENKQRSVHLVVSENASAESVTKVMDLCRRVGLQKFSMQTK